MKVSWALAVQEMPVIVVHQPSLQVGLEMELAVRRLPPPTAVAPANCKPLLVVAVVESKVHRNVHYSSCINTW